MSSVRDQARGLESIVSICILGVLILIGVGIFIKQSSYDMSRFGLGPEQTAGIELSPQRSGEDTQEILTFGSLMPQGFNTLSHTELYNPENLYEKINGKAPLYLESGFVSLSTQRFISKEDESLWMELFVYDMANIKNAFSVYSVQKRAGVELLPSMQFAYKTSNGLYFVHGKYYIELLGSCESAELLQVMGQVVEKISVNLPIDREVKVAELALFPKEGLVPGGAKLYLANAFGFAGLIDTFAARYKIGDETITAFLGRYSDSKDARNKAQSYYNFLIENGGKVKPAVSEALKTIESKVVDFYGTTEIVFAIGPFVAGVHEAESQPSAEKLAAVLANKLNQAEKAMSND